MKYILNKLSTFTIAFYSDLIEIDSKRIPSDKLKLLVSACHQVMDLLKESADGAPVSADDFLPALIYCVLRANPPLLQSNITYITNFAQQTDLQSGEAGYFFTNLVRNLILMF